MFTKLWAVLQANQKLVLLTFEIFWILIFLLERFGKAGAGSVPGFLYVNF